MPLEPHKHITQNVFFKILDMAADAVLIINENDEIIYSNPQVAYLFDYQENELFGAPLTKLIPQEHYQMHHQYIKDFIASGQESKFMSDREKDVHGVKSNGKKIPLNISIVNIDNLENGGYYAAAIIRDGTEQKGVENHLQRLAEYDDLTGLLNRRVFNQIASAGLENAKRYHHSLSLLLMDIDYFKDVNDTYGHTYGDDVLKKLSSLIQKNIRSSDVLARWGGEEFIVLLSETSLEQAKIAAEKMRALIQYKEFITPEGQQLAITISLGLTKVEVMGEDSLNIAFNNADKALYTAKENGRNRVEIAT